MFKSSDYQQNVTSGVSKILQPGTHFCRIINLTLEAPPYKPDGYFVNVLLETKPVGDDFVGLAKDKNNPEGEKYLGQIGTVKSGQYCFSDFEYKGEIIERDNQIWRWVNSLAKQLGVLDKMNADGLEADTIEEYVAHVKRYVAKPDLWGLFTIAGKEYFTEGYSKPNYSLFFPKSEKGNFPFSALFDESEDPQNFLTYDAAKHIVTKNVEKPSVPSVESFGKDISASTLSFDMPPTQPTAPKLPFDDMPF